MAAGAELFTGNNLFVMAWADRRITTRRLLRNWAVVLPLGLLVKESGRDSFWQTAGVSVGDYGDLTWTAAVLENLVPVTLGNVFGGAVMVGLVHWLVYRRHG